jgi:hypothetical protein
VGRAVVTSLGGSRKRDGFENENIRIRPGSRGKTSEIR